MLIEERKSRILNLLKERDVVTIPELIDSLQVSEATIRRDLAYLDSINALKRVHGGATAMKKSLIEPTYNEKQNINVDDKKAIAKYAASLVENGDSIYLDAGTTTYEMVPYLEGKDIVVVTNGLKHIELLIESKIEAYIIGGKIKSSTKAVVGIEAIRNLERYKFDKSFLGINGIHLIHGYTTPDAEESTLKEMAMKASKESFVLADESKFGQQYFMQVASLDKASIITSSSTNFGEYSKLTEIRKVEEE
ncbi:DeoR/GlpR family DNA-binding transcription regulator [Clostridium cellulovorans]|nr:DeoR/GlpR family DNA-binding transcription regulator [Clostridium cellulovorans]